MFFSSVVRAAGNEQVAWKRIVHSAIQLVHELFYLNFRRSLKLKLTVEKARTSEAARYTLEWFSSGSLNGIWSLHKATFRCGSVKPLSH